MKILWKYCGSIFQLGFFIFSIIFLSFISFSSIHVSFLLFFFLFLVFLLHTSVQSYLYLPFFYFLFHLKNIPVLATSHFVHIREKREKEKVRRKTAAYPPPHHRWRSRSPKGQSQWRSMVTMQHYHVRRSSSSPPLG